MGQSSAKTAKYKNNYNFQNIQTNSIRKVTRSTFRLYQNFDSSSHLKINSWVSEYRVK